MMKELAYYDGRVGAPEEVMIPFNDRVHFFGDGVYEATLGGNHRVFLLQDHLDRFYSSAKALEIRIPMEKEELGRLLTELLEKVEGVGQVQVMLTFEGTGEKKVEKDVALDLEERREETVYEERGNSERTPYVTSETNPEVKGVLVIAQGGGNSRVRQEILEAAQALFGIDAHKIKIMKMEEMK